MYDFWGQTLGMKRVYPQIGVMLLATGLAPLCAAAESGWADILLQPRFQFQHQTFSKGSQPGTDELYDTAANGHRLYLDPDNPMSAHVEQYDATFTFPVLPANKAMNLDLGVNIRFIDGDFRGETPDSPASRINTTLPMLYATAFFSLPFDGLSASFAGSHAEFDEYRAFDYRARLNYDWQNGFGLEGGWQHQRFNIDSSDVQADFEVKGPYLDLKYRF